ncbi:MAG: tetraacyldisaccharide 4'-kinase [Myxococcota bacterium]|nr:tetraacyldisaccharide 4'-kinase [Myxococcota bacterium]
MDRYIKNSLLSRAGATLYRAAQRIHAESYKNGMLPIHRIDNIRVISVGNLRAGGSGKTPFAMYLVAWLQKQGVRAALVLRGYRGRLEHRGGFVSVGHGPMVSPLAAGDEGFLAAERLRGAAIWVGADRATGVRAVRDAGAEVVVLDDGFQHQRLYRDLDIVLVCPEDVNLKTRFLPAGPLRESPAALCRADVTGGFYQDWCGHPTSPPLLFEYVPAHFVDLSRRHTRGIEALRDTRAYLVAGISRPERFFATAAEIGLKIVGARAFRDHHAFTSRDAEAISAAAQQSNADAIVTTEKDAVRLAAVHLRRPVWALRVDLRIRSGLDVLDKTLSLDPLPAARPTDLRGKRR